MKNGKFHCTLANWCRFYCTHRCHDTLFFLNFDKIRANEFNIMLSDVILLIIYYLIPHKMYKLFISKTSVNETRNRAHLHFRWHYITMATMASGVLGVYRGIRLYQFRTIMFTTFYVTIRHIQTKIHKFTTAYTHLLIYKYPITTAVSLPWCNIIAIVYNLLQM